MTLMTPLYHPYARLWLPLHAAGWLMMAGVVTFAAETSLAWPDRSTGDHRSYLRKVGVALVLLSIAGGHWGERRPSPLAFRSFFEPTDDLRACVTFLPEPANLNVRPADRGGYTKLLVLGRRPLAFYLAVRRSIPFQMMSDESGLYRESIRTGDSVLLDEVMSESSIQRVDEDLYDLWIPVSPFSPATRLDPVTLLDIRPGVAFDSNESRFSRVELFRPRTNRSSRPLF